MSGLFWYSIDCCCFRSFSLLPVSPLPPLPPPPPAMTWPVRSVWTLSLILMSGWPVTRLSRRSSALLRSFVTLLASWSPDLKPPATLLLRPNCPQLLMILSTATWTLWLSAPVELSWDLVLEYWNLSVVYSSQINQWLTYLKLFTTKSKLNTRENK